MHYNKIKVLNQGIDDLKRHGVASSGPGWERFFLEGVGVEGRGIEVSFWNLKKLFSHEQSCI